MKFTVVFLLFCAVVFGGQAVVVSKFRCVGRKKKIQKVNFCNGKTDCGNGADEKINTALFSQYKFISCNNTANKYNGSCPLIVKYICTEMITCYGKSPCDVGCPNHFLCPDGKTCLKRNTVCDGNTCNDCPGVQRWSNGHSFKCVRNGRKCNLPQVLLYDNVKDCDDGSDLCYGGSSNRTSLTGNTPQLANFNSSRCFRCLDKSMIIARASMCDGVFDCPDMSDECICEGKIPEICSKVTTQSPKKRKCAVGQVECLDGKCLNRSQVCDGVIDCANGMDEKYAFCKGTMPCGNVTVPGETCRCQKMASVTCNQVVGRYCDGVQDCLQTLNLNHRYLASPEDECRGPCAAQPRNASGANFVNCSGLATHSEAQLGKFPNMTCYRNRVAVRVIPGEKVCDGVKDCPPKSSNDEYRRRCRQWRFPCGTVDGLVNIDRSKVCDGYVDCMKGGDEAPKTCKKRNRHACSSLQGTKMSISRSEVCDGIINCDDQSDETNCTADGRFYCENKQPLFVEKRKVFNGIGDCSDWSDECPSVRKADSSVFSSRYELIGTPILRVVVWITGILATVGNLVVLGTEVSALKRSATQSASLRTNHMLVLNLAVADLLMGIYLLMLGATGLGYSGNYCVNDLYWRSSDTCTAMGILVVLSSEASVLTMVLLTSFRIYAVWNPFTAGSKPSWKVVFLALLLIWAVTCLLAFLPLGNQFQNRFTTTAMISEMPFFKSILVEYSSFKSFLERLLTFGPRFNSTVVAAIQSSNLNKATSWMDLSNILSNSKNYSHTLTVKRYFGYYSTNSVCMPKILVTTKDKAWPFSLSISIFNFVAFVYVSFAYLAIYLKTTAGAVVLKGGKKSRAASKTGKGNKQNQEIQKKIVRLIITDFCCWVPVSIMTFMHFAGVPLPPDVYAVTAIVLLPINSALNPIIYSNLIDNLLKCCPCCGSDDKKKRTGSTSSTTQLSRVH